MRGNPDAHAALLQATAATAGPAVERHFRFPCAMPLQNIGLIRNVFVDDHVIVDVHFPVVVEIPVEPARHAAGDALVDARVVVDVDFPIE